MPRIACYPGTFDPITNGHIDIITRCAKLYDSIIVGVAQNDKKNPLFSFAERMQLTEQVLGAMPNVKVHGFGELTIEFARKHSAQVILRGLRAVSDFDFEFQLAAMNRKMATDVETVFIPASATDAYISSSLVREIAALNGDVSEFVPQVVATALYNKLRGG